MIVDEPQNIRIEAAASQPAGTILKPVTRVAAKMKTTAIWRRAAIVVATILAFVLFAMMLGRAPLLAQNTSSSSARIELTSRDLALIATEFLQPEQQARLASSLEERQGFIKSLRQMLALAQVAKQENYEERAETKIQLDFRTDYVLFQAYKKKNPNVNATDDDINAYFQAHPKEWADFVEANRYLRQQPETVKKEFGQIKVLAERARKDGMDKEEATKLSMLVARSQILAEAYFRDLQKDSDKLVSNEDVERYYNEHKDEFEEASVRHILIRTRALGYENLDDKSGKDQKKPAEMKAPTKEEARKKAQAILDRIRKGEDFAKLAKETSDDPGSKMNGGDLGFFEKGVMVPEFDRASFSLSPGQVSELVETEFGFHIIKVEGRRISPLDEKVREKIKSKLEQQVFEKRVDEIVNKAGVKVADDFTLNTTPKPPASPGSRNQQGGNQ